MKSAGRAARGFHMTIKHGARSDPPEDEAQRSPRPLCHELFPAPSPPARGRSVAKSEVVNFLAFNKKFGKTVFVVRTSITH